MNPIVTLGSIWPTTVEGPFVLYFEICTQLISVNISSDNSILSLMNFLQNKWYRYHNYLMHHMLPVS